MCVTAVENTEGGQWCVSRQWKTQKKDSGVCHGSGKHSRRTVVRVTAVENTVGGQWCVSPPEAGDRGASTLPGGRQMGCSLAARAFAVQAAAGRWRCAGCPQRQWRCLSRGSRGSTTGNGEDKATAGESCLAACHPGGP